MIMWRPRSWTARASPSGPMWSVRSAPQSAPDARASDAWRRPLRYLRAAVHSGDLSMIDDNGLLPRRDRKKDMIKTGGENVASREVEEVPTGTPGSEEVAVFDRRASRLGRGRGGRGGVIRGGQHPLRRRTSWRTAGEHLAGLRRPNASSWTRCPRTPAGSCSNAN